MTVIKVKSDPYRRIVDFYTLKESTGEWVGVNSINNPNSNLIKDNIKKNFFPYKVKEIVDIIMREYAISGEQIRIVFYGTSDEYKEIAYVCDRYECITLEWGSEYLENARDILPQIRDIFDKVKPIIDKSIEREDAKAEIEKDIAKFLDASNDIIPICVLGNVSSGKSTFINSLLGMEILPSGDFPVTAKIYQIKNTTSNDDTIISFEQNKQRINIIISPNSYKIEGQLDSELKHNIEQALKANSSEHISAKVNACLSAINEKADEVSDLIDIQILFGEGLLKKAKNTFVIFDTPGSNAAMHQDHYVLLKQAMRNMSNGIPIYVAEYKALDTCDNVNLYESLKQISQIDIRFTMIVVNKADAANIKETSFDEAAEQRILSQSVPRNLYSGGIYFVSSLMGLGSKNNGVFIDEHLEEVFEDNKTKYSEPTCKRYKELYKYNIMPEQIKNSIVAESEQAENKIFANSGLMAMEHEILNFAEKYSAYDKCKQSNTYIENIIDATQSEIDDAKALSEAIKSQIEFELEDDKRMLIVSMENRINDLTESFLGKYDHEMSEFYKGELFTFDSDRMKMLEAKISDEKRAANDYEKELQEVKQSGAAMLDNIGKPFDEFAKGVKDAWGDLRELREVKIKSDMETSDELISVVTADFNSRGYNATANLDDASREYWEANTEKVKTELSMIVADSPTLEEDKKRELEEIIISYDSVKFTDEHVFEKASFERRFYIFGKVIDLNRINTRKLADTYNKDYSSAIHKVYEEIRASHGDSFETWKNQLVDKIRNNIVDYSPKLSEQARKIEFETQKIADLSETKRVLTGYSNQIQKLMSWR